MYDRLDNAYALKKHFKKHCKYIYHKSSPIFILVNLIAGVSMAIGGALLSPKTIAGQSCIILGLASVIVNALHWNYRKNM